MTAVLYLSVSRVATDTRARVCLYIVLSEVIMQLESVNGSNIYYIHGCSASDILYTIVVLYYMYYTHTYIPYKIYYILSLGNRAI